MHMRQISICDYVRVMWCNHAIDDTIYIFFDAFQQGFNILIWLLSAVHKKSYASCFRVTKLAWFKIKVWSAASHNPLTEFGNCIFVAHFYILFSIWICTQSQSLNQVQRHILFNFSVSMNLEGMLGITQAPVITSSHT